MSAVEVRCFVMHRLGSGTTFRWVVRVFERHAPAVLSVQPLSCLRSGTLVQSIAKQQQQLHSRYLIASLTCKRHFWQGRANMCTTSHTTLDPDETKKFQSLAKRWWDEQGEFAALHSMNDLRVPFIRDNLLNRNGRRKPGSPLSGYKILDVGCGGGLLSEPLGRLGALVTGIDPLKDSIRTAEVHKSFDPVLNKQIHYSSCLLEDITEEAAETFDAVVASEVVEHVNDLETFINSCYEVLKPGASLFITTINKTNLSYSLAIVAAENILKIVPRGTHDWDKFINPVDLERILESTFPTGHWPVIWRCAVDLHGVEAWSCDQRTPTNLQLLW
ncbi:ubiquinone biosynthesis O-methyltransferase, mitochondrial-like isoform X2 [Polyodon spathula]|uniref:ubiquinone biosynthesis O-methyltransferase, mitochondrial-like isoform X2 n=1 Tax=Polyodon spathula TaxID=7913 RepID=UPI001B7E2E6B|nr:ubiquinone biosynthesis O-methyltransferase, mitochondrial-like isoform X2 [Polyodon spathula]